jgi:tripartite-type tricarboxylate transporter receptor subunit TctC
MDILGWRSVVGPPDLPAAVVQKWGKAVRAVTEDPKWRDKVQKLGDEPGFMDARTFGEFIDKEYKRFSGAAKELGIVVGR